MASLKITIKQLAKRFVNFPLKICVSKQLKVVGIKVRDDATKKFGHYQPEVGPYPGWPPLAPATIRIKSSAGGGEDPLIGHYPNGHQNKVWPVPLRTTIKYRSWIWQVQIGTKDPLGLIHEFGTTKIPPRPFLRPAVYENQAFYVERMTLAVKEAIDLM